MPASESMNKASSVGSYLRESRESRGIALEDAARVTRIGKNYLAALEDDLFHTLPNAAYVKGFLRAYAAFLGLSGDEVVAMYEKALSPPSQYPAGEKAAPAAPGARRGGPSRRSRWAVPIILLALVLTVAYLFEEKEPKPEITPPPVAASPAATVPAPVLPPRSSVQVQPQPEKAGLPAETGKGDLVAANAGPPGDGVVLKLKVNQDCWLTITIDDAVSQQYDLKAGDLIEWKGDGMFALDIGNAGGIEAEFNGRPLKPFGEQGKPAHVVLKRGGAQS